VECSGPEGSSTLYESARAPVTPALIAEITDRVAEAGHGPTPYSAARRFALVLHDLSAVLSARDPVGPDEPTTPVTLDVDGTDHVVAVPEQHLAWLVERIEGDLNTLAEYGPAHLGHCSCCHRDEDCVVI
jgi:hypothetical protein